MLLELQSVVIIVFTFAAVLAAASASAGSCIRVGLLSRALPGSFLPLHKLLEESALSEIVRAGAVYLTPLTGRLVEASRFLLAIAPIGPGRFARTEVSSEDRRLGLAPQ